MKHNIVSAINALVPFGQDFTLGGPTGETVSYKEPLQPNLPTQEELEAYRDNLNTEEPYKQLRAKRDKLLAETDWWAVSDRTMSEEQADYRQTLRDITENCVPQLNAQFKLDDASVNWPVKPE